MDFCILKIKLTFKIILFLDKTNKKYSYLLFLKIDNSINSFNAYFILIMFVIHIFLLFYQNIFVQKLIMYIGI